METLLGFEHETQLCSGTSYQVVFIHCYHTWAVSPKYMNKMTTFHTCISTSYSAADDNPLVSD